MRVLPASLRLAGGGIQALTARIRIACGRIQVLPASIRLVCGRTQVLQASIRLVRGRDPGPPGEQSPRPAMVSGRDSLVTISWSRLRPAVRRDSGRRHRLLGRGLPHWLGLGSLGPWAAPGSLPRRARQPHVAEIHFESLEQAVAHAREAGIVGALKSEADPFAAYIDSTDFSSGWGNVGRYLHCRISDFSPGARIDLKYQVIGDSSSFADNREHVAAVGWARRDSLDLPRRKYMRPYVRFCVPAQDFELAPYLAIDGEQFHVGERYGGLTRLEEVFGHQGIQLTRRDFVLLLWLALEADRLSRDTLEVPCSAIAGKPAWHPDWRQVRTGISRRFAGPVHVRERVIVWAPHARIEFDDRTRCRAFVSRPRPASEPGSGPGRGEIMELLCTVENLAERLRAVMREMS